MTKKQRRDELILRHGLLLQRIFPATKSMGPVALYKRLHRLEVEACNANVRECNEQLPAGWSEKKEASLLRRLNALLGYKAASVPVFLSGDPRGHALKIEDFWVRAEGADIYRDLGGYGILAPDF